MQVVIIGGVSSGVGKTTISTGIMGTLAHHNFKVQPFKTGPDYIDTTYHTWVTGCPSRNLDTWMLSRKAVIELFHRAMTGKEIGIIEGVMGLYDGHAAINDTASTAELAKVLNVPVILIVDSGNAARSSAAIVKGFQAFDPLLNIGGVILNGIASEGHYNICKDAIEHYTGVKVMGYLPRRKDLVLPERHLGLVPTVEGPASEEFRRTLVEQCEKTIDIQGILKLSEQAAPPPTSPELFPEEYHEPVVRVAVARDKAFSFYYQDSLDLLAAWGAEVIPFSPLDDDKLPRDIGGLYIGGGFPEMYAKELAANISLKQSIKIAAQTGMPVYGECGGLMYLGSVIHDFGGKAYSMTGVLPITTRMDKPQLTLGYRTVRAIADGPFLRKEESTRGHEFHWSNLDGAKGLTPAYIIEEKNGLEEGFHLGNVLASYVHIHLGSHPSMAPHFVDTCRRLRKNNRL